MMAGFIISLIFLIKILLYYALEKRERAFNAHEIIPVSLIKT